MKYPNVWPTVLSSNDGLKLVLGMLSFNPPLASSIRLDQFEPPKTCLYQKSVDKVLELAKNEETISIISNRFVNQLRRLNTKFDCPFTYYFFRTSGLITQSHQSHPYSIFTLADFGKDILVEILALFANDRCIPILKNGALSQLLGKPSTFMHLHIVITNKSVEGTILQTFGYLN
ncbi:hypothetical protein G6F37_005552 [Rhizopus arrhizus]|nr:hypothetical protein G6F38_002058 [Rhizopus arrhizus]KAG1158700.1 hypothetical protein G6F37_005552 [Rhizopus arrhizus]